MKKGVGCGGYRRNGEGFGECGWLRGGGWNWL